MSDDTYGGAIYRAVRKLATGEGLVFFGIVYAIAFFSLPIMIAFERQRGIMDAISQLGTTDLRAAAVAALIVHLLLATWAEMDNVEAAKNG